MDEDESAPPTPPDTPQSPTTPQSPPTTSEPTEASPAAPPSVPAPQVIMLPVGQAGLPGQMSFPPGIGMAGVGGVPGQLVLGIQQQSSWQGPYPPPEAAERFEILHPGAFGRILTMAEREQTARIESVNQAQRFQSSDVGRGQWLGAAVSVLALGAAIVCARLGYPWLGGACVGVPVLAVALALVQSARQPSGNQTITLSNPVASTVPAVVPQPGSGQLPAKAPSGPPPT